MRWRNEYHAERAIWKHRKIPVWFIWHKGVWFSIEANGLVMCIKMSLRGSV